MLPLKQKEIKNLDFVLSRLGYEAKGLIESIQNMSEEQKNYIPNPSVQEIGEFRLGGEIHQWMYDRFSLRLLLESCRFRNIKVVSAYESKIKDFEKYSFDTIDGNVRIPQSLFMEAQK